MKHKNKLKHLAIIKRKENIYVHAAFMISLYITILVWPWNRLKKSVYDGRFISKYQLCLFHLSSPSLPKLTYSRLLMTMMDKGWWTSVILKPWIWHCRNIFFFPPLTWLHRVRRFHTTRINQSSIIYSESSKLCSFRQQPTQPHKTPQSLTHI